MAMCSRVISPSFLSGSVDIWENGGRKTCLWLVIEVMLLSRDELWQRNAHGCSYVSMCSASQKLSVSCEWDYKCRGTTLHQRIMECTVFGIGGKTMQVTASTSCVAASHGPCKCWTGDHFVVKSSAIGQPTWLTQPAIPQGSVNE